MSTEQHLSNNVMFTHRFCIAPMMDWSDRHCRFLWRLLSTHALLYTEMVTTGALLHGDQDRFLRYNDDEHPVALQLGGSEPADLAQCARTAKQWGYDEVNLNCGCPSDRVQNGMIGACLMAHPHQVADCIKAMQDAVDIPITIKHRIGIDDMDDYQGLENFVSIVAETGCKVFIIHARKAWLQGLSPKQNRELPPLMYEHVYRLKKERPDLTIVINGGIQSLNECEQHLKYVDGVMMGREAYSNPHVLAEVDSRIFNAGESVIDRKDVLKQYIDYCAKEMNKGTRLHHMSKHILGLFQGVKGARAFRRHISENAFRTDADIDVLNTALAKIQ
jgi:tRNA-dihydrouridine synthase A